MPLTEKLKSMDNNELRTVWKALETFPQTPQSSWKDPGPYGCDTMEDWAMIIDGEMSRRKLK